MTPLPQNTEPSLRRCQRLFAARPSARARAFSRSGSPAARSSSVKKISPGCPIASSSRQPRMRSAPAFQVVISPSASSATMAYSLALSRIRRKRSSLSRWAPSALRRSAIASRSWRSDLVHLGEPRFGQHSGPVGRGRGAGERPDRLGDPARDPEGEAEPEQEEAAAKERSEEEPLPERRRELALRHPDPDAPARRLGSAEGGERGHALMGPRGDDAPLRAMMLRIEGGRRALPDEALGVRDAGDRGAGPVEDADGPVRRRPLLGDDLGEALEGVVEGELVDHAPVPNDRHVDADHRALDYASDEEVRHTGRPVSKRAASTAGSPRSGRGCPSARRVFELLAVLVRDDDEAVRRQGLEELLGLAAEGRRSPLRKARETASPWSPAIADSARARRRATCRARSRACARRRARGPAGG